MFKKLMCSAVLCALFSLPLQAQEVQTTESNDAIRVSVKEGKLPGQVFTNLGESKTLLPGKVTLIDSEGNTISTSNADGEGNFMFTDVEPGQYKAVGVAGDYAGEATLVISAEGEVVDGEAVAEAGSFQMIPLEVGPAASGAIYESYGELPASSISDVVYEGSGSCNACNSCAAASPCGGSTVQSFGGSCGCGGGGSGGAFGGGGFNFRRLALIGGITAIAVAVSDDDDAATPDE